MSRRSQQRDSQAREREAAERTWAMLTWVRWTALAGTGTRLARMPYESGLNLGAQLLGRPGLFQ